MPDSHREERGDSPQPGAKPGATLNSAPSVTFGFVRVEELVGDVAQDGGAARGDAALGQEGVEGAEGMVDALGVLEAAGFLGEGRQEVLGVARL